jgi:putative phage-type endonuclease
MSEYPTNVKSVNENLWKCKNRGEQCSTLGLQPPEKGKKLMALVTIERSPDILGNGVLLGDFKSNSPEWHELRKTGIGGSDVAGICKVSPWTSPYGVWARKTGRIEDTVSQTEAMEWGTRLEAVILQKFADEHPEFHVRTGFGTYANKTRPWQISNPDGVFEWDVVDRHGDDQSISVHRGIVEVKTARYEDDWRDGVPAYYRTQVQWYLQTFGYNRAFVVVLFSGSKYAEFEIWADEFEQAANLSEVEKMRELILADTAPDLDGSTSTYETVRQLHPDIDTEGAVELGDLFIHYSNAIAALDDATSHANEMKSRVLDALGNAKRGLYDDKWVVTRQARNGGTPYLVNKKG